MHIYSAINESKKPYIQLQTEYLLETPVFHRFYTYSGANSLLSALTNKEK